MKIASEGHWRIEDLKDAICNALISLSESAKKRKQKVLWTIRHRQKRTIS